MDATGKLGVHAPSSWTSVGTTAQIGSVVIGPSLAVSPDVDAFHAGWGTEGVFLFASKSLFDDFGTPESYLAELPDYQPCTSKDTRPYQDGVYRGAADYFTECGTEGVNAFQLVAEPINEPGYLIVVQYKASTSDDPAIRQKIFETFYYDGIFDWAP